MGIQISPLFGSRSQNLTKAILLHVSDFKELHLHLSQKRMCSSLLEKVNRSSNILTRNSFLKTEVDYSDLLDAFTLDTA